MIDDYSIIPKNDVERIQRIISCTQLELDRWSWLSPKQQQGLEQKILRFEQHLEEYRHETV